MPPFHGRQIRSAGLRMFSRSCSARIVGKPSLTGLRKGCSSFARNRRYAPLELSDSSKLDCFHGRSPLRRISRSLTAIRTLQFPLRVADLPVRRVGRLFLLSKENPMNRAISVRMIIIGLFYLLYQAGLAQVESLSTSSSSARRTNCTSTAIGSMALVHGGTLEIGIDTAQIPRFQRIFNLDSPQLFQDEVPKHSVTIDDFYIDKYPVTNTEFERFVDANPQWQPDRIPHDLDNGNYLKHWKLNPPTTQGDHPVVNVNWYAAVAYCRYAGKRLPTEAEWEHAARGGLNALFPWGNQPVDNSRANFSDAGLSTTSPVGKYPANGYGLFDMAGNVWQFLADEWKPYSSASQKNPVAGGNRFLDGPAFLTVKTRRVIRGGSFGGAPVNMWVEYRDSHPPDGSRDFVGFRCAK